MFDIDKVGGSGTALARLAAGASVDEIKAKTVADFSVSPSLEAEAA